MDGELMNADVRGSRAGRAGLSESREASCVYLDKNAQDMLQSTDSIDPGIAPCEMASKIRTGWKLPRPIDPARSQRSMLLLDFRSVNDLHQLRLRKMNNSFLAVPKSCGMILKCGRQQEVEVNKEAKWGNTRQWDACSNRLVLLIGPCTIRRLSHQRAEILEEN